MIAVSPALKAQIQKLRGRRLQARVRIDYSDVNIDNTTRASANSIEDNSYFDQVYNGKFDTTLPWASLDGSWVIGLYALAPETISEQEAYEIGWWSQELSNDNAEWPELSGKLYGEDLYGESVYSRSSTPLTLNVTFSERTISEINIAFDNARMEYGVNFDIELYSIGGTLLDALSVTGNAGVRYAQEISPVNLVAEIRLILYKWSHPGRQAKVCEFFTSVSEVYGQGDIINLDVIESRELSDTTPVGSSASGRCVVSMYNRDRRFDYDNVTSKLYNLIRENVRIVPEIGDGTEWIPLGYFYAKEWDISKQSIIATVTGVDRVALLGETSYTASTFIEAPIDESYDIDSDANWNGGTMENTMSSSNSLRLRYV